MPRQIRTLYRQVDIDDRRVTVRSLPIFAALLAAAGVLAVVVVWGLVWLQGRFFGDHSYDVWAVWMTRIVLPCCFILVAISVFDSRHPQVVVDGEAATITFLGNLRRRIVVPFSAVRALSVGENILIEAQADRPEMRVTGLWLQTDGQQYLLTTLLRGEDLSATLVAEIERVVAAGGGAIGGPVPVVEHRTRSYSRAIISGTLIVGGVAFSLLTWCCAPDKVVEDCRLWPLGLWFAAAGLLEAADVPMISGVNSMPAPQSWLMAALWLGSYWYLCHVS